MCNKPALEKVSLSHIHTSRMHSQTYYTYLSTSLHTYFNAPHSPSAFRTLSCRQWSHHYNYNYHNPTGIMQLRNGKDASQIELINLDSHSHPYTLRLRLPLVSTPHSMYRWCETTYALPPVGWWCRGRCGVRMDAPRVQTAVCGVQMRGCVMKTAAS